jgi:hypothetical protein
MRARHGSHIDGFSIFPGSDSGATSVIPEAVLDTNDDPGTISLENEKKKRIHGECAYHRLVKTTPNPRATKNSRGELVGPPPLPLPLLAPVAGSWVELGAIVGAVAVKTAAEDMLSGSGF